MNYWNKNRNKHWF